MFLLGTVPLTTYTPAQRFTGSLLLGGCVHPLWESLLSSHADFHKTPFNILQPRSPCYQCGVTLGTQRWHRSVLILRCLWHSIPSVNTLEGAIDFDSTVFSKKIRDLGQSVIETHTELKPFCMILSYLPFQDLSPAPRYLSIQPAIFKAKMLMLPLRFLLLSWKVFSPLNPFLS